MCLRTRADSPSAGGVTTARRGGGIGGYHVARYGSPARPRRSRRQGRPRVAPDLAPPEDVRRAVHEQARTWPWTPATSAARIRPVTPLASPQWSVDHRHERRAADVVTRFARAHRLLITR